MLFFYKLVIASWQSWDDSLYIAAIIHHR